jgi:tRNA G10  N-methylase Trm11
MRNHPAVFSDSILRYLVNSDLLPMGTLLDPFAGTGKVHQLACAGRQTVGVEIEPEWAAMHPATVVGNALALPFEAESFDGAVTSPVFGNRMSDSHRAKDGTLRRSYTHDLQHLTGDPERKLHPDNAGTLYAWQPKYWRFHHKAWRELHRVLRPGAAFFLDVSDCIHEGRRIDVVDNHAALCESIGFELTDTHEVKTPRNGYGAHGQTRVDVEHILELRRA